MKNLVKILLAGFIFLLFVIFFFRSCQPNSEESKEGNKKSSSKTPAEYSYKTIEYGSEYGERQHLSSGEWFAFVDATEPYCCINNDEHEECGEKGQDISTQMGDSEANTMLKFKSSNGKTGQLTIRIRNK